MVASRLYLSALLLTFVVPAHAASINTTPLTLTQKHIETLGTGVAIALPLTAAGVTLYKDDAMGFAQLIVETILTVGTTYGLKNIVHEERPNGSDDQSFPSGTSALASS